MNKLAAKKLIEARERLNLTQRELAESLASQLGQTYSLRQYQKLEEGLFPKYKKEIVQELDKILGSNIYALVYEQNVPREVAPYPDHGPNGSYREQLKAKKLQSEPHLVHLVPVKAQAGYAKGYDNTDFLNKLEMYPILPGIDPRGAIWRWFEVQGDSMENSLFEKDLVLVSMVPPEDWSEQKEGKVYVIVTNTDVWIKILMKKEKGSWILGSSNKRHKQRSVKIEDIKEVWKYRVHVTSRLAKN